MQSQPTPDMNAARKAEQERANKLKADQELRNMLVKEVNDFQMELYKFVVTSQEMQFKVNFVVFLIVSMAHAILLRSRT